MVADLRALVPVQGSQTESYRRAKWRRSVAVLRRLRGRRHSCDRRRSEVNLDNGHVVSCILCFSWSFSGTIFETGWARLGQLQKRARRSGTGFLGSSCWMLDMSMRRGWEGVEATGGRPDDDSPLDRRTCVRVPLIAVAVHGQSRPLTGARGRGRGITSTAAPALLGRVSLSLCVCLSACEKRGRRVRGTGSGGRGFLRPHLFSPCSPHSGTCKTGRLMRLLVPVPMLEVV